MLWKGLAMNSADFMQAKLDRLGDKIANLKAQGICSHGWLKTLPGQQKTTCLDCGATFDSFEQALLTYWLYVFNEQMNDADIEWIELEPEQATTSALFLHWLDVWSDDSRGALFDMLTIEGANHA